MKLAFAATVALCVLVTPTCSAEITAVASFSILGDLVHQVGGDRVTVKTIVGPDGDAHAYQITPTDAADVARADIFFVNGLGFEGWMDRLVESTGFQGELVVVSRGVPTHETTEEDFGDDHNLEERDPHAWQSLLNGVLYVRNIERALCKVDAPGCRQYSANAAAYIKELEALDAQIKYQISTISPEKRTVITTHDAFAYFGDAYEVTFLAPEGVSTDVEASAADVARFIEQIVTQGVTAIFVENMSDPRLIQQIASETGATIGGELYADALSGPSGPAPTYIELFKHNVRALFGTAETEWSGIAAQGF